jgi:hypothetical protein
VTRYVDAETEEGALAQMHALGKITYTCETLGPRIRVCDECHWDRSELGGQYRLTLSAYGYTISTVIDPITQPADEVLHAFAADTPVTIAVCAADKRWHECPQCQRVANSAAHRTVRATLIIPG